MHRYGGKRYGFSKKHKLTGKKQIGELFRFGKYETYGFLRFRYLPKSQGYIRVVISISKRVGNSPERNRLKRLIREALRLSQCLDRISHDWGVYVTSPLYRKPTLSEMQDHIGQFIASLPQ